MQLPRHLAFPVLVLSLLAFVGRSWAEDIRSGDWTIRKSADPGKVEFSLFGRGQGGNSNHASDWPASAFSGVDLSRAGHQEVHFVISRDAGRIDCDGFLDNGEGAGIFHFRPDANYVRAMHLLGFSVDEDKQYSMALQDVGIDFARQMKAGQLTDLDADKLIAFRIFHVDSAFVEDLRAAGVNISDSDKLVAFRIHGVTPQMVRFLRQAGYSPDADTLIAMRIHGATPEWMQDLKARGYDHLDLQKLIAFRIHGVSPEFIAKLQGLGYAHPDPDELVAMRIHNVTPEYIDELRSRGMKGLSVDQLVSMRIHGID